MNMINELKNHDVAPETTLTERERSQSDALLRSVLADRAATPTRHAPNSKAKTRGWALAGAGAGVAAAALIVGGVVVAPHLANRLGVGAATASGPLTTVELADWTSTPTQDVTPAARQWCLNFMAGGPGAGSATTITNQDQRGQVASMFVNRGGYSMLCIAGPDGTGFWELDGTPSDPAPTVASDGVTIESAGSHGDGASGFTYVEGYVGTDVKSISITDAGKTFAATVEAGRWTAWWPTADPHGTVTGTVTITTTDGASHTVPGESLKK
jgi:hypothetical protein